MVEMHLCISLTGSRSYTNARSKSRFFNMPVEKRKKKEKKRKGKQIDLQYDIIVHRIYPLARYSKGLADPDIHPCFSSGSPEHVRPVPQIQPCHGVMPPAFSSKPVSLNTA